MTAGVCTIFGRHGESPLFAYAVCVLLKNTEKAALQGPKERTMKRREFLKTAAAATLPLAADQLLGALQTVMAAQPGVSEHVEATSGSMLYRPLGRTGEKFR